MSPRADRAVRFNVDTCPLAVTIPYNTRRFHREPRDFNGHIF
jgi:hypothetical protein